MLFCATVAVHSLLSQDQQRSRGVVIDLKIEAHVTGVDAPVVASANSAFRLGLLLLDTVASAHR